MQQHIEENKPHPRPAVTPACTPAPGAHASLAQAWGEEATPAFAEHSLEQF